jgi:hypothetical protein
LQLFASRFKERILLDGQRNCRLRIWEIDFELNSGSQRERSPWRLPYQRIQRVSSRRLLRCQVPTRLTSLRPERLFCEQVAASDFTCFELALTNREKAGPIIKGS